MVTIFAYGLLRHEDRQIMLSYSDEDRWNAAGVNHFEHVGHGVLRDFKLLGTQPDSIVEATGEAAEGEVYRVPESMLPNLDAFEGCYGTGRDSQGMYFRREETVEVNGEPVTCTMWQYTDRILRYYCS